MVARLGKALIRLLVPLLVSAVTSLTFFSGTDVDALTEVMTILVAGAYYVLVYVLERYVHRRFGWLLGVPGIPHYEVNDRFENEDK